MTKCKAAVIFSISYSIIITVLFLIAVYPEDRTVKVAPIQYESKGIMLSHIIEGVERNTDYCVVAREDIKNIRIYGRFQGDNWVDILEKVINSYNTQLKLVIYEKNRLIVIVWRQ